MITLDITEWKQKGDELKLEIVNAVRSTQATLIQPLPDRLLMTLGQFNMLKNDADMVPMAQESGHVYLTSENAMEVVIKDDNLPEKREHVILTP